MSVNNLINNMSDLNLNSIVLNKLYTHTIKNYSFGNMPIDQLNECFKDGRVFSHVFEKYLTNLHNLSWVKGNKDHDLLDNKKIKYEQKTFTNQCNFRPSKSTGVGRTHNQIDFENHAKNLIYIIVDNQNFPNIKYKFIKGSDLLKMYPTGIIYKSSKQFFFKEFETEKVKNAIKNYSAFHNKNVSEITICDILISSAGVEGWANAKI